MDSIKKLQGNIDLGVGIATLSLGEDYYFLDAEDASRVMEEAWGNPPSEYLGMIFPSRYTPFDDASWGVTVEYIEDGYVSDEEADEVDYAELLETLQKEAEEGNSQRAELGYPTYSLLGWASAPHYDAETHKIHWAKELSFDGYDTNTLNYNIRILGRKGYLMMNFVANMSEFDEIQESREEVLAAANFNDGYLYSQFDSKIDNYAAYGIGALVAGKVIAKTGIFLKFLLIFKKLWFVLFAGIAGFYKWITGRSDKSQKNLPDQTV